MFCIDKTRQLVAKKADCIYSFGVCRALFEQFSGVLTRLTGCHHCDPLDLTHRRRGRSKAEISRCTLDTHIYLCYASGRYEKRVG